MPAVINLPLYIGSPAQHAYELKAAYEWGCFVRYLELGDDGFALRQVDEYENGYLIRYDRLHWDDQFGTLADFRFGRLWLEHWGEPIVITREQFEGKWTAARHSAPFAERAESPTEQAPWIALFEAGKWSGQA